MHLNKSVSLALSAALVLAAAVPAFSGTGLKSENKPLTLQEYIKAHPNLEVEYRYSKHAAPVIDNRIAATKVKLPANTPVVLKLNDTVNGNEVTQGSTINFTVIGDVKVNNTVVIKAGSQARAQVTMVDENSLIGQAGKILISDFGVQAVDGVFVPLRGSLSDKGKDKVILSAGLSIFLCPLFLLLKGGEATVPAGMEKTTYTASDAEITITQQ